MIPFLRRRPIVVACVVVAGASCSSKDHAPLAPPVSGFDPVWPTGNTVQQDVLIAPKNAVVTIDTATTTGPTQLFKVSTKERRDVSSDSDMAIRDKGIGVFSGTLLKTTGVLPTDLPYATTLVAARYQGLIGFERLSLVKLSVSGDAPDVPILYKQGAPSSPSRSILKFGSALGQIDVAVVLDTTGSMGGSINDLKTNITSKLFPALTKSIASVGIAIVDHKDYPISPFGDVGDWPVKVRQLVTTDVLLASKALGTMSAGGGNDYPEAQIPAMWHVLTGGELSWSGGTVPKHTPAAGTFGGVDFRPGSLPVVVLITDIDWHDVTNSPYSSGVTSPPSFDDLKAKFLETHALFVDVTDSVGGVGKETQANALSDATNSNVPPSAFGAKCEAGKCCSGVGGAPRLPDGPSGRCRLNFLHDGGKGVSDTIATAIQGIKAGLVTDVHAVISNDPANPDGVDATKLIEYFRPVAEGDAASGCNAHAAIDSDSDGKLDTFTAVTSDSNVCFEVKVKDNVTIASGETVKVYFAYVDFFGASGAALQRRRIAFIVPPIDLVAK